MSNSDQAYESHILKITINKYLDQKLTNPQEDLETIELNKDELVWDVVTTIHNQSGYKVSIPFARDIIEQRIINIKEQIREAEEKARIEIMRIEAEKVEKETKIINFIKNLPPELKFDKTKLYIFIKVYKICGKYHLCDKLNELDSDNFFDQKLFIKILKTTILEDYSKAYALIDLEEELDIYIDDAEADTLETVRDIVEYIYTKINSPESF